VSAGTEGKGVARGRGIGIARVVHVFVFVSIVGSVQGNMRNVHIIRGGMQRIGDQKSVIEIY
jgi:hypothetical protein